MHNCAADCPQYLNQRSSGPQLTIGNCHCRSSQLRATDTPSACKFSTVQTVQNFVVKQAGMAGGKAGLKS